MARWRLGPAYLGLALSSASASGSLTMHFVSTSLSRDRTCVPRLRDRIRLSLLSKAMRGYRLAPLPRIPDILRNFPTTSGTYRPMASLLALHAACYVSFRPGPLHRFSRYYGPLQLPNWPEHGLRRLSVPAHRLRLRRAGSPAGAPEFLSSHTLATAPVEMVATGCSPGHHRRSSPYFRRVDLHITLFEACSAFKRIGLVHAGLLNRLCDPSSSKCFRRIVSSTTAPIATGWSNSYRAGFSSCLNSVPFHGTLKCPR